ncbi:MAG: AAA family ATPase [Deltaproteobacteria bacterium]|jgi:general secretion pathway protein A|nr:AAA family ATPase [Deltaproteobacteria bacterium]MBW2582881.1 AAA family ATPase [Deltaproteobacteria bacterium]MBW2656460.1 AAA family ATPase [Deltaproteobacteria bacterium]
MFLNHFDLTAHPFAEKPPIDWLLRDERTDQALARLKFFEQQGAIALIIGQTGLGKSSLLRLFIDQLPHNRYHPVYLHLTPLNANAFLRLIVTKLGEKPLMGKDRMLMQILDRININDKCTLFIIDEAHLIDPKILTDLRLLISSIDQEVSLKILLCGQESLTQILKRSSYADLVQRITLQFVMQPLSQEKTVAYIDYRITKSGGVTKIFEAEAKSLIHEYTGGVPRQINNVATACLINAAARNIKKITEPLVNETMAEFSLP